MARFSCNSTASIPPPPDRCLPSATTTALHEHCFFFFCRRHVGFVFVFVMHVTNWMLLLSGTSASIIAYVVFCRILSRRCNSDPRTPRTRRGSSWAAVKTTAALTANASCSLHCSAAT